MRVVAPPRPTLVFIHGAQNDHGVWAVLGRHFAAQGYPVVTPDLPGHGGNTDAPLTSIDAMAAWMATELAQLGAGGTALVLIGHSMGSLVALECAARASAGTSTRIAGLVLIGTAVPMKVSPALLQQARADEAGAIAQIVLWSHLPLANGGRNEIMAQAQAMMARQPRGLLYTDLAACDAYAHGLEAASAIRCPGLIIAGSQDRMTPPKAIRVLHQTLAAARLVSIANGSHSLMAEFPDAIQTTIADFLVPLR